MTLRRVHDQERELRRLLALLCVRRTLDCLSVLGVVPLVLIGLSHGAP